MLQQQPPPAHCGCCRRCFCGGCKHWVSEYVNRVGPSGQIYVWVFGAPAQSCPYVACTCVCAKLGHPNLRHLSLAEIQVPFNLQLFGTRCCLPLPLEVVSTSYVRRHVVLLVLPNHSRHPKMCMMDALKKRGCLVHTWWLAIHTYIVLAPPHEQRTP